MFTDQLRVCVSSINSLCGDCEANLDTIAREAAAAEGRADLLVTPECSICGHAPGPEIQAAVEPLRGPSVKRLTELAKKHRLAISAGIAERSRAEWPYNTQVLVGRQGLIAKQRKLHLSSNENCFNEPGSKIEAAALGPWRVGTVICYDNNFPELHRLLALRGCELILSPHAARFGYPANKNFRRAKAAGLNRAKITYAAMAMANACYSVYVNQVGIAGRLSSKLSDGHVAHAGGILVVGPAGDVLATHSKAANAPERMFVTLDRSRAAQVRRSPSQSLNARRPELFGDLASPRLRGAHRRRYGIPKHGAWWAIEGHEPRRTP